MADKSELNTRRKIVAELGPGDSLGTGISALLSGAEKYIAFDVVRHSNSARDLKIFQELVKLFRNKCSIPGDDEFPELKPKLSSYDFPAYLFKRDRLDYLLKPDRLRRIMNSVLMPNGRQSLIRYCVPWSGTTPHMQGIINMIYSQAVLEHVDKLVELYNCMHRWLASDGFLSHQIDFKCHGTSDQWNGYWKHSDFLWALMRGKRPYLINREPYSTHRNLLQLHDFRIVYEKKYTSSNLLMRKKLCSRFQNISDDDLITSGAFIQATKKGQL